jgi:soluble lytic murein transglycosylase-like protein
LSADVQDIDKFSDKERTYYSSHFGQKKSIISLQSPAGMVDHVTMRNSPWNQSLKTISITGFITLTSCGCAGPTTPFGALHTLTPVEPIFESDELVIETTEILTETQHEWITRGPSSIAPQIALSPKAQVLHDKMDLTVAIQDQQGLSRHSRLEVFFNGQKVIMQKKYFSPPDDPTKGYYTFPNVRLRDDRENRIVTTYQSGESFPLIRAVLPPPDCIWQKQAVVHNTDPFSTSAEVLNLVMTQSHLDRVNSSLVTGMIAQESAFDSMAVSWAKALGLMQITPIADRQISEQFPNWPRDARINDLSAGQLKWLITSGNLNHSHDWRLDPERSIQGGIAVLKDMHAYWSRAEAQEVLQKHLSPLKRNETDLILASYHAGPVRVRRAIATYGDAYLLSAELSKTIRYVKRVKSYCHHFAEREWTP